MKKRHLVAFIVIIVCAVILMCMNFDEYNELVYGSKTTESVEYNNE